MFLELYFKHNAEFKRKDRFANGLTVKDSVEILDLDF
jgi:hypothetical protein